LCFLAALLAWDHDLCRAVLAVYVRALLGFYRRRAACGSVRGGRSGAVTVIQRFGSAVNLNVHFHTLVLDGVFVEDGTGLLRFHALFPPTDEEVARLLAAIRRRVLRLLERRGLGAGDHPAPADPLAEESPALAGISGASVQGRIALGARAGGRVLRVGSDPDAPWVTVGGPRRAHLEGFDLHADLRVGANDRGRLEHLCRYLLRPALPEGRLRLAYDRRIVLELKRAWSDGTTHLVFTPLELLEKLAALVPRPRINLVIYHGLLAAHARLRAATVRFAGEASGDNAGPSRGGENSGAAPPTAAVLSATERTVNRPEPRVDPAAPGEPAPPERRERPASMRHWPWAALMQRSFGTDVLACRRCGGRMRLLATIKDPKAIRKILSHLGLSSELPRPLPARPPPSAARQLGLGVLALESPVA